MLPEAIARIDQKAAEAREFFADAIPDMSDPRMLLGALVATRFMQYEFVHSKNHTRDMGIAIEALCEVLGA